MCWPLLGFLALQQRDQDAERREQSGAEIGDRNADAHRPLPRQAGDRHQAAHALRDLIEARPVGVGAVLAEAGNAGIDEARIDLGERLVVDAEPLLHVGAEILDHDVGLLDHALEGGEAFGRLQIERHAALVAVQVLKVASPRAGRPSALPARAAISILMTLAPQSASWRTQVGPDRTRVRSSTVKRARAFEARGKGIAGVSAAGLAGVILPAES